MEFGCMKVGGNNKNDKMVLGLREENGNFKDKENDIEDME